MNLPNFLSSLRIFLVPVFLVTFFKSPSYVSFLVFVFLILTDALDGFIARAWNQKTRLGSFLDPIGDKLLINTIYFSLAFRGEIPLWMAFVVLGRDIIIVSGWLVVYFSKSFSDVIPTIVGKVAAIIQMVVATLLLLAYSKICLVTFLTSIKGYLLVLMIGFTIISGVTYLFRDIRQFSRSKLSSREGG